MDEQKREEGEHEEQGRRHKGGGKGKLVGQQHGSSDEQQQEGELHSEGGRKQKARGDLIEGQSTKKAHLEGLS